MLPFLCAPCDLVPHVPQALSTLVPYMASSLHALMPHALHAVMPSVPCTPHTLLPYMPCFLCALVPHMLLCPVFSLAPCASCLTHLGSWVFSRFMSPFLLCTNSVSYLKVYLPYKTIFCNKVALDV